MRWPLAHVQTLTRDNEQEGVASAAPSSPPAAASV